jgi:Spy/CpxP family protein refolding chaperone
LLYKSLRDLQRRLTNGAQHFMVFLHLLRGSMNTPIEPNSGNHASPRSLFNRMTFAVLVAGATLVGGVAALASGAGACGWHHGMMTGTHSAAEVSAHVDHMLKHLYVDIDATDAQKAQITPLVNQAVADLLPLHTQLQAAHAQILQGLTQNPIDRAALEAARVAHLQLADQASKRIVQLIADVGDVLTPAQRNALATHLKTMHGKAST